MLDNRKLLAFAIAVSVTGVIALYFYAATIEPQDMNIADIGHEDVGYLARISGTVKEVRIMEDGSMSCELVDPETNASIVVYVQSDVYNDYVNDEPGPSPGAVFQFTGVIETYQDVFELVVSSSNDIYKIEAAGEALIPIHQLLLSPEIFDGMTVWVEGTIEDPYIISDSNGTKGMGFELQEIHDNTTHRLVCVVFDNDMIGDHDTGSLIRVTGTFQYYSGTGSWQVFMDDEADIFLVP